ncbi:MAG: phosphoribosylglycinamide formyltransferase [Chitinophagaceae bacterium]
MHRIVIFASGSGSNALNLIRHFNSGDFARVVGVFCNKPDAGVIHKAEAEQVEVTLFNRNDFYHTEEVISKVAALQPDIIVLAGFLWLVPSSFIKAFDGKIINLHPSLLPKFGGKGMYGHHVHEAVLAAGEKYTGITIHLVNEEFDKGEKIYQDQFEIPANATVSDVEQLIHQLEHKGMPIAVEQFLKRL